ncbi:hypothetical protein DPMN_073955 [Dreissena polymorpha]|uniref:Uncharacterized protein n=1 Tax=Dreissena polymorpha TaxID=45954 RepID=A0A9D3YHR4_DREPO|nr:hypothetical protein DPMN_073955 [Dreissena polymorpha]
MEFLQAATQELMWLHEREELEVTRDWSSSRLNVPAIEDFYKVGWYRSLEGGNNTTGPIFTKQFLDLSIRT